MLSVTTLDVLGRLSFAEATFGVAGLGLLWYIISSVAAWTKLRHIPGPLFASISYTWCFWITYCGRGHLILEAEHEKHGDIFRVGPDAVATSDPDTIMRLNSARSTYTRGPWYSGTRFDPHGDSVINELDSTKHGKHKAKLFMAFSGKSLASMENKVDEWIAALIGALRGRIAKGEETMDIGILIQYFQVDMISDIEMGQAWGDLSEDRDHFGYIRLSEWLVPSVQSFPFLPIARNIVRSSWFSLFLGPRTIGNSGLGRFIGLIKEEVNSRFDDSTGMVKRSNDVLDSWVQHGLSEAECRYDLSLLIPAGSETSIMMIRGTLLLLMTSPPVYQKVKQEIRDGIAAGLISDPVSNDEAKNLDYMQAVIHEGMRLMAPISFGFPKRVPASGDMVCGKQLPAGTDVYLNSYGMMRQKAVFGNDTEVFRPERFLGGGPNVAHMVKVVDAVFGGGRFVCLGKAFAYIEINKIFVELLRNFDFQVARPEKPWKRTSHSTWIVSDFHARVTEDKTMEQH